MQWYEGHCDGDWEHGFGPEIETIDNPGWRLKIRSTLRSVTGRSFTGVSKITTMTPIGGPVGPKITRFTGRAVPGSWRRWLRLVGSGSRASA